MSTFEPDEPESAPVSALFDLLKFAAFFAAGFVTIILVANVAMWMLDMRP